MGVTAFPIPRFPSYTGQKSDERTILTIRRRYLPMVSTSLYYFGAPKRLRGSSLTTMVAQERDPSNGVLWGLARAEGGDSEGQRLVMGR